jgi:hypothetical protein
MHHEQASPSLINKKQQGDPSTICAVLQTMTPPACSNNGSTLSESTASNEATFLQPLLRCGPNYLRKKLAVWCK